MPVDGWLVLVFFMGNHAKNIPQITKKCYYLRWFAAAKGHSMELSKIKGFYPYLMVVFFNSFIDLGHKILIQDTLYQTATGPMYTILSAIINALILLPYILLFTPSGFLSDKFAKVSVLRITAAAAIPLTIIITWCYYQGYFWGAFALTLSLSIQSAINSPAKYGFIKEIFGKEHLASANALVQTLAIIAILGGTFAFTILFTHYLTVDNLLQAKDHSLLLKSFAPAGFFLILFSMFETLMTFLLPKKSAADPSSTYSVSKYVRGQYIRPYLKSVQRRPVILTSILGLALFWAINQVLLAGYGAFLKEHVGHVSALFAQGSLAIGGLGILFGALYAGKISEGFIETGLIPAAAIGITVGLFFIPINKNEIFIVLLFLVYGFFGGMLIVPLNALIQFSAGRRELGKVLATNNFIQNIFMVGFLVATVILTYLGADSRVTLYGLFVLSLGATIYAFVKLPQSLVRFVIYFIVSKFYRITVLGLENMPSTRGVFLLGNHTSFLDWAILQIASPRPIRFVLERSIYEKWYLNWLLRYFSIIPISRGASKEAIARIRTALNDGHVVCLFPEGCLSRNGHVGTFHTGFERAAVDTKAVIMPFYIRGLWGTTTSYATDRYKRLSRIRTRRISVTFGERMSVDAKAPEVKRKVMELSIRSWKYYTSTLLSLQCEWLRRAEQMGNTLCLIDGVGGEFTHYKLIAVVMYFVRKLKSQFADQDNIGIILPSSAGGVIANLTVLCAGKTVVNLNYTSGLNTVSYTLEKAHIKTIITSHAFLKQLKARGFDVSSLLTSYNTLYLEDYKKPSSKVAIANNLMLVKVLPRFLLQRIFIKPTDNNSTAAILFSSGSEGKPKGIELSHRNIIGNIKQISSVFNIKERDTVLNILPLFHAFGLTVTTLMPLIEGVPFVCYPDPTNAEAIGKLAFRYRVTVLCGTSTFFGIYARSKKVYPMMFQHIRLVIAGAEKLSLSVREAFKQKFNLDVYEGYGATEIAPVASANLPDVLSAEDWHVHIANKVGTVGLPLPGSAFRVVDPDTMEELPVGEDGLILIGGVQVMKGYLDDVDKTESVLIKEKNITWYKSGDKGHVDDEGYLTIVDRYSRFAKIGGEMISLTVVEQRVLEAINEPDNQVMIATLPDAKKGEKLCLLYTATLEPEEIHARLLSSDIEKLMIPSVMLHIDELPKLGSGKRDYVTAKQMMATAQANA